MQCTHSGVPLLGHKTTDTLRKRRYVAGNDDKRKTERESVCVSE